MPELILIPNSLHDEHYECIPEYVKHSIEGINVFIFENPKPFRRLLVKLGFRDKINNAITIQMDKHNKDSAWWQQLDSLKTENIGLVSDAGSPAIADPGSALVSWAHSNNFKIKPLAGPNSIVLGLMGSGLNGQSFAFHGYLPIEDGKRKKMIIKLEAESKSSNQTKIFIETPYRNDQLFKTLKNQLSNSTKLCIASGLTSDGELILTKRVEEWKRSNHTIGKTPSIFLFLA